MVTSKVILIIGATSGIGRASAERLCALGHRVYGAGRRVGPGPEWAGLPYRALRCDVRDEASIAGCVREVLADAGRIDVLVYCAGFTYAGAVEDMSTEELREQFETNFFGAHRVIREVMGVMRRQGGGTILAISSVGSEFVLPYQSAYSQSKMALDGLILAVRMEGAAFGIRAACVQPGDARTDNTAARRLARRCVESSPYYQGTLAAIERMERDERNGISPDAVARLVARLAGRRRLRPKYRVEPQYRLLVFLKRLLPAGSSERVLMKMYGRRPLPGSPAGTPAGTPAGKGGL